jgi:hypothetical protein
MTTAQASVLMVPHNFAKGDASRVTRQMIRINYNDTGATEIRTFGSVPAMGTVDLVIPALSSGTLACARADDIKRIGSTTVRPYGVYG